MEKETYEVIINEKKYILKKKMSGQEEHLCGIKKFISSFFENDGKKADMMKLVFADDFHETSIQMISYLSDYPKMSVEQVLQLDSDVLLTLKMETLMQYAESFKSLSDYMEKKKLMIPKSLQTEFCNSLETNPEEAYNLLASQRNSRVPLK
jgi:hypothetical protein